MDPRKKGVHEEAFGKGLYPFRHGRVDEQLIREYRSRTPMGVVALDLRIALMTFRKIADADGLLDPFGRDAEKKRGPS